MTVVGRQAIYDTGQRVVAHELLFRSLGSDRAEVTDADHATAEVLISAFTDIGMDELVGGHLAFVNIPYRFLVEGFCSMLPPERVVLEVLEDVLVDDAVVRTIEGLVDDGFVIALDDFEYRPDLEPLLDLASIIKVDLLALSGEELDRTLDRLSPFDCRLLAEKIEDREDVPHLINQGFELFQGYGLDKPQLVHSTKASSNRTIMLQVMSELFKPDLEIREVADTISHDPSLAYALLRIVNSAAMRRAYRISSLQHAVVMLGIDALRNWATMLLMTRVSDGSSTSLTKALVRAKLSERVAVEAGGHEAIGFTVGLLSALPELMGESLPAIVERLSLDPIVEDALLYQEGPYGRLLSWVLAYEAGDETRLIKLGAPSRLATAFLESMAWAHNISTTIGAPSD
jgi:EAL and modified HD-GYP domain-containing signal transduction protein